MNYPKRKRTRLKDFDYSQNGAYFITICTKDKRCILSRVILPVGTGVPDGPSIELSEYGKIAKRYLHQISDFYEYLSIDQYVIMPNHIHLMLRVSQQNDLTLTASPTTTIQNSIVSRFVSTFKRFCNKECGQNIWQSRSYDHIIRDETDYWIKMNYIHENPIRWYYDELYCDK